MSKIKDSIKGVIKKTIWYRLKYLEKQNVRRSEETVELSQAIGDLQTRIEALGKEKILSIISDREALSFLGRELSITPVVWGDRSRLHVSDKAAVYSALFNVNSGEITIGDYTFAGSNVSFLTGSHDMELIGFLRRNYEIKEGNDIVIGEGVWIASNATIIGPCKIEDNAVIAAGAVVVPGTYVGRDEVYGGVPAKKIAEIDRNEIISIENESIRKALEREEGVLFIDGWSDKQYVEYKGRLYAGHLMIENEATIFSDKEKIELFYEVEDKEPSLSIEFNGKKHEIIEKQGTLIIEDTGMSVIGKSSNKKIFFGR